MSASIRELRDKNRLFVDQLRRDPKASGGLLAEARHRGDLALLGEALAAEAVRLYGVGELEEAGTLNAEAVELLNDQPARARDPFFAWMVRTTGGMLCEAHGDSEAARGHFAQALEIGRSAKMLDLTARSLMSLGFLANRESDPVTALVHYLGLLRIPNLEDSTVAVTYLYLAQLFEDQEQWDLAMLYLGEGLTRAGGFAPDLEASMRGLDAELLARTGDLDGAWEALEVAIQIADPGSVHAAKLDGCRARVLLESGEYERAEELALSSLDVVARQGVWSHVGRLVGVLCEVYLRTNQPEKLLEVIDRHDLDVLPARWARDLLRSQIEAHRMLGHYEQAVRSHDRFVELADSHFDAAAFYRLHRQLADVHSLEAQHSALISRQIELARLQEELIELLDRVANDLNSPLTTLRLVFDALGFDDAPSSVQRRLPRAAEAIERMSSLAEQFSSAQDGTQVAWH